MMRFKYPLITMVVLSAIFMFTSCQNEPTIVEPGEATQQGLSKFSLPEGATFVSATYYVEVEVATSQNINVHRITSPWEETVVTWNNFGGSYAPEVEGTFNASTVGWNYVDVTVLVRNWLDGTYPNYGLLLDQVDQTWPRTQYDTREYGGSAGASYLEIFYTVNGGPVVSDTTRNIGDTYIYELNPDQNIGHGNVMYTGWGWAADLEKQSLVMFDMEAIPQELECETAFAYGGDDEDCFSYYGFSRWGWTNGPLSEGTYSFDIYAAAGLCDITKGTLVGTLDVEYTGGTATVTYNIDPAFTLDEIHLYIGSDPIPENKKGKPTVAPGQYPYSDQTSYTVDGLSGDIWIIAHAGICGFE